MGTRIPRKLYERLGKLAEQEGVSVSFLVIEALRDLLNKYEPQPRTQAALTKGGRKHGQG